MNVAIAAAEPPRQTTSSAAGAIWGPHLVGMDERVARWATVTLTRFAELSAPDVGANALAGIVRTASGIAASREERAGPPEFAAASDPEECLPAEVPSGYRSAWRLTAPIVAMPGYLDYLAARFGRAGGASPFPAKLASAERREHAGAISAGDRQLHRLWRPRACAGPGGDAGSRPGRGGQEPRPHRVLCRHGDRSDGPDVPDPARRRGGARRHGAAGQLESRAGPGDR